MNGIILKFPEPILQLPRKKPDWATRIVKPKTHGQYIQKTRKLDDKVFLQIPKYE